MGTDTVSEGGIERLFAGSKCLQTSRYGNCLGYQQLCDTLPDMEIHGSV